MPPRISHDGWQREFRFSRANTEEMIFNCFDLVSFISTNMTLLPGDVVLTGTPSGVGLIQSGDRLEVRLQGSAPLINTVA